VTSTLVIARRSFLNKLGVSWIVLSDCHGEARRKDGPIWAKIRTVSSDTNVSPTDTIVQSIRPRAFGLIKRASPCPGEQS